MIDKVFLDTNVVVYLLAEDAERAAKSCELVSAGATISTQVINEYINVCVRKLGMSREAAHETAEALMRACEVVPVEASTVRRAMKISRRYGFSHWDSLILAAANEASCAVLYSEDMQHGQEIEGVRVINPFG